eukprot:SAG31_NODE_8437_length_1452_cov_2.221729_4_plen_98_part_00
MISQNFTLPWNVKGMTFLYRITNPGHRDSVGSSFQVVLNLIRNGLVKYILFYFIFYILFCFQVILNAVDETIANKPGCTMCNNPMQVRGNGSWSCAL